MAKSCFSYALSRLRGTPEVPIDAYEIDELRKEFRLAGMDNAEAVAILGDADGPTVVHMAVREENSVYSHRPRRGAQVETVNVTDIKPDGFHGFLCGRRLGDKIVISPPKEKLLFIKRRK